MQSLRSFISESGISNNERCYREFTHLCAAHNVSIDGISVKETPRHNWNVYQGDKRLFLVSRYVLNQSIIDEYKIPVKEG